MAVSAENRIRYRAIMVSRMAKDIFLGVPERFAKRIAGRFFLGPLLRWLFLGPDDKPHRAGEIVLAELRNRFALRSPFSTDPATMGRNVGRREVLECLFNYLNLDEGEVQKMMELDDGLN